MAVYEYQGFDATGRVTAGTVEAPTEKGALDQLSGRGIVPTHLNEGEEGQTPAAARVATRKVLESRRVSRGAVTLFLRELATFIQADIPLLEALDVLRKQEEQARFKAILDEVHDRVQGGEALSIALQRFPRVFSPLLISMVRVGETGGLLGPMLEQMATWMEHEDEVRGEIRGALAYPAMIVTLGVVTVIILMTVVLPRIGAIFTGMEAQLPWITRTLMKTAGWTGQWWWLLGLIAAGLVLITAQALATERGRNLRDRLVLRIPVLGVVMRKSAIARFARASAALLTAGVPLLETLTVVRGLLGNVVLTEMVDGAVDGVTRGQSLARTLRSSQYLPQSVVHLLGVGERTGRLDDMFSRIATTFEKQTRDQIKTLLGLISPLMIIALAVLVAMIAISILLPIFKMNQLMR